MMAHSEGPRTVNELVTGYLRVIVIVIVVSLRLVRSFTPNFYVFVYLCGGPSSVAGRLNVRRRQMCLNLTTFFPRWQNKR